ncbi:hypothetical protein V8D89_009445 [Ganoderma adspersum]
MDSVSQHALPSSVLSAFRESLACGYIATVISACIYGITILQAYIYFRNNTQDSRHMGKFVAVMVILDTISMILILVGGYEYIVIDFGNPLAYLDIPPTYPILIGTLTQWSVPSFTVVTVSHYPTSFFAHRIWALSKGNITLVVAIVILSLCSFGTGMAFSVHLHTNNSVLSFASAEVRIVMGTSSGLGVLCDIIITASLCYYLHSSRTGFRSTNSMINKLIVYAVNRGTLTAICQALEMIAIVALVGRGCFTFVPFNFLSGRLYCNTLLATLNAQRSMSRNLDTVVELGTLVFHRGTTSRSGNELHFNSAGWMGSISDHPECTSPSFVIDITVEKTVDVVPAPSGDDESASHM